MNILIKFHKNSALSSIFDFVLHHLHHLWIIMTMTITASINNITANISITNTSITSIIAIIIIELWTCELRTVQAGSLLL